MSRPQGPQPHKWIRFVTCIGVLWECRVCLLWTKKLDQQKRERRNCPGHIIP